jgi:hypothetical protein
LRLCLSSLETSKVFKTFEVFPKASAESAGRRQRPDLFLIFNCSCIFIKAVWTMAASRFTAIAAFEVKLFSKDFEPFRRQVKIFAFGEFIFIILFLHSGKPNDNPKDFGLVKIK